MRVNAAIDVRARDVAVSASQSLENVLCCSQTGLEGPVDVFADAELLPSEGVLSRPRCGCLGTSLGSEAWHGSAVHAALVFELPGAPLGGLAVCAAARGAARAEC